MTTIIGIGGTLRENSRSYIALEYAMNHINAQGIKTEIYALYDLDLPMFYPNKKENDYGDNVKTFLSALRKADGVIFSTGAYHGTMAGATKNMFDFIEYMHNDNIPFLHNRAVGLIATAGGTMAGVNTLTGMVHTIHALRGVVVPLQVSIGQAGKHVADGQVTDEGTQKRLKELAKETLRLSQALNPVAAGV